MKLTIPSETLFLCMLANAYATYYELNYRAQCSNSPDFDCNDVNQSLVSDMVCLI